MSDLTRIDTPLSTEGLAAMTDPGGRVYIAFPDNGPVQNTGRHVSDFDLTAAEPFAVQFRNARATLAQMPVQRTWYPTEIGVVIHRDLSDVDRRYGHEDVVLTPELLAALTDGKVLEISVGDDEFTVSLRMQ